VEGARAAYRDVGCGRVLSRTTNQNELPAPISLRTSSSPPHLIEQFSRHGQAEPETFVSTCGGAVHLREPLEDLLQSVLCDADSRVDDLDPRLSSATGRPVKHQLHHDLIGVGEAYRVVDQGRDDLPQPLRVSHYGPG
jgi:hypothetical protein